MPQPDDTSLTRRKLLGAGLTLGGLCATSRFTGTVPFASADTLTASAPSPTTTSAAPVLCQNDLAIDDTTALLFSSQSPLTPAAGLRDARAVWSRVLTHHDKSVLLYFHGNNNYVSVDAKGRSRVPDWATTPEAQAGAAGKPAAPLSYKLDKLDTRHRPVVLLPEVGALTTKSFWGREPSGQFTDPARLGALIGDCKAHLACLHRPGGKPYLSEKQAKATPKRVLLSGHSGAGLPLEEAAVSSLILPKSGVPSDLWLFDCTYWSKVDGFVSFVQQWHDAGLLNGGDSKAARFVCVYKPKTQTEEIADSLRTTVAGILGVPPLSLLQLHSKDNFEAQIAPVVKKAGVTFIATDLPHDEIPTFFIPALLDTAA